MPVPHFLPWTLHRTARAPVNLTPNRGPRTAICTGCRGTHASPYVRCARQCSDGMIIDDEATHRGRRAGGRAGGPTARRVATLDVEPRRRARREPFEHDSRTRQRRARTPSRGGQPWSPLPVDCHDVRTPGPVATVAARDGAAPRATTTRAGTGKGGGDHGDDGDGGAHSPEKPLTPPPDSSLKGTSATAPAIRPRRGGRARWATRARLAAAPGLRHVEKPLTANGRR